MGDEQGDVGQASTELVLSGKLPSEPIVESMGGENQVEESYEEGDGGEIMVEVVGSDVFVDGISAQKGGYLESGEVGDLEGHALENREDSGTQNFSEAMDLLSEGDGNTKGESDVGFLESRDENNHVVAEEVNVSSSEEKVIRDEAVDQDSASLVTSERVNRPVEAVDDGKVGIVGKEEILTSSDNAAGHNDLVEDSIMSHEATNAGNEAQVAPSEVSLNPTCEGGEVLATGSPRNGDFKAKAESASTDGDGGIGTQIVNEMEVLAADGKESIPKRDALVSDVHDENQGCLNELRDVKCEPAHGTGDASHAHPESSPEKSLVSERRGVIGVKLDGVIDFKDRPSDTNLSNDECSKSDGDLETDMVSNEPNQPADGGDTAEVGSQEKVENTDIQAGAKENQPNTATSSCLGDTEIVQADPGMSKDQSLVAVSMVEVTNHQKIGISQVKVVDRDGSSDKGPDIDLEISMQSSECLGNAENPTLDASTENMHLAEEVSCSEVEMADVRVVEDHIACNLPVVSADVGLDNVVDECGSSDVRVAEDHVASDLPVVNAEVELDNVVEECGSSQRREQEVAVEITKTSDDPIQITETSDHGVDKLERINLIPDEAASTAVDSVVNHASISPEITEKAEMHDSDDIEETSLCDVATSGDELNKSREAEDNSGKTNGFYVVEGHTSETKLMDVNEERESDRKYHGETEVDHAVSCALEEVSRRVQLGLACSCIPKDAYGKIETQVVENTGIREESSRRYGVDKSSKADDFEPEKLLEYVKDLAPRASSMADPLDLVIARAQLSAFYCFKGYRLPAEFPSSEELEDNDVDTEQISDEMIGSDECKNTPEDGSPSRNERSLSELMGDEDESVALSSGMKRKALEPLAHESDKRVSIDDAKVSTSTSQTPKPSFKIGECIRKVASQLTGPTSSVKRNNDEMVIDGSPKIHELSERRSVVLSAESFSVNEMLSQLQLLAQDPKKRHNFQNNIHTFFLGFRSSIALNRRGRKRKAETTHGGSGEEYEFDDVNDSYWTDRIVQNYAEEQQLHNSENGAGNLQLVQVTAEKSIKPGRKTHSRKRFSSGNYPMEAVELDENVKRKNQESSPAELILNFAERNRVPSEINLNKIFRRFGPLMESETEVDHDSGRAKVIFKRGSDAEVAHSSAEKFNIFGPVLVNYQIGYSPLISVKILPVSIPQCHEDATLML